MLPLSTEKKIQSMTMVQLTIIYKDLTKITTNWYKYNNKEIINVERFA